MKLKETKTISGVAHYFVNFSSVAFSMKMKIKKPSVVENLLPNFFKHKKYEIHFDLSFPPAKGMNIER